MNSIFIKEYNKFLESDFSPSEEIIEKAFIYHLINNLGYFYRDDIKNADKLKENFKAHFRRINEPILVTDDEFNCQFENWWIEFNSGNILDRFITLKSKWFQLKDNNGNVLKTFSYFDFDNIENNHFEVINQLNNNSKENKNRYDVIILINGIPTIHIELKNESINVDEGSRQINKYLESGSLPSFLRFTKLYVVSNGTKTRYFVNNKSISNDIKNIPIMWVDINGNYVDGKNGILNFSNYFFDKKFLLDYINNYFVIDKDKQNIKVFKPYQYYATNKILENIRNIELNNKEKSGYVWHATGSGKTLTSFKTCEILANSKEVDLTIFLIDRNDLNTQTFNNFCSFACDKNLVKNAIDTNNLVELLIDKNSDKKIIITTIQKLNIALKKERNDKLLPIANKKVVFVVDECHRSQIGEMRKNIDNFFNNSINIAFTGTPIFDENSIDGKTTESIFGELIHKYTSYDAIKDGNVLEFVFKFTDLVKLEEDKKDNKYEDELEDELEENNCISIDLGRIKTIVDYISKNYDKLTRNKTFNAMLACSSILEAIEYYNMISENTNLSCAIIYSVNKSDNSKNSEISQHAKSFLIDRIKEYNPSWVDNFDNTNNNDIFSKYKTHIQKDFADRKYDLLIVVSMLLTGYDSPITNTLFLDKKLRYQSLIQAISRTNRLHYGKECGNIVSFKTSKYDVDEAFSLYTNGGIVTPTIWPILTYDDVKNEFNKCIDYLLESFPNINDVVSINTSDIDKCVKFINLYKKIMKVFNKIKPLIDFKWDDFKITEREFKQYKEHYNFLVSNNNDVKLIHLWEDYDVVDLDEIRIDTSYLKKLFKEIKKFHENEIPNSIEDFYYYKYLINKIDNNAYNDQNVDILKCFLKNKEIYTSGDFSKINELWKKYIYKKIENTTEKVKIKWKTNSESIKNLIDNFRIKNEIDNGFIHDLLPNYIIDPLYDDDKFDDVKKEISKLLWLEKIYEIKTI